MGQEQEMQDQACPNVRQRAHLRPDRAGGALAKRPHLHHAYLKMGNFRLGRDSRGFRTEMTFGREIRFLSLFFLHLPHDNKPLKGNKQAQIRDGSGESRHTYL